ncbi:MAG: hypothetical protein OHK0053_01310 [Microscillaceae bacterium]
MEGENGFWQKKDLSNTKWTLEVISVGPGWGYQIMYNHKIVIHQPYVPGLASKRVFASKSLACEMGARVLFKIKNGKHPSITYKDFYQMQIQENEDLFLSD